jgi:hypothetical protein
MDKCRSIFGGRSTYTLYSAEQMLTIMQCMQVGAPPPLHHHHHQPDLSLRSFTKLPLALSHRFPLRFRRL